MILTLFNILFVSLRFRSFQVLKVPFARKWRHFTIGDDVFFAVASNSRSHDSPVFKWNGNMFIPFQRLPTVKAFDVEPFHIGQDTFLAVAIYYGRGSHIFKWDGERFVKFQEIAAVGADVDHFHMNGSTFLAITGKDVSRTRKFLFCFSLTCSRGICNIWIENSNFLSFLTFIHTNFSLNCLRTHVF